jgi:hypothetical protein
VTRRARLRCAQGGRYPRGWERNLLLM